MLRRLAAGQEVASGVRVDDPAGEELEGGDGDQVGEEARREVLPELERQDGEGDGESVELVAHDAGASQVDDGLEVSRDEDVDRLFATLGEEERDATGGRHRAEIEG